MRRLIITLLALALAGCSSPWEPEGAVPFDPPPIYKQWWVVTEECSGISGDYQRVQWYMVSARATSNQGDIGGTLVVGLVWWVPPHQIYIAEPWVLRESVVRHVMLHDLLQDEYDGPTFEICGLV